VCRCTGIGRTGVMYDSVIGDGMNFSPLLSCPANCTDFSGQYIGGWKDNQRHGAGMFQSVDGIKYQGEWKDDCKVGRGVATDGKAHCEVYTDGRLDPDRGFAFGLADLPYVKLWV